MREMNIVFLLVGERDFLDSNRDNPGLVLVRKRGIFEPPIGWTGIILGLLLVGRVKFSRYGF